MCKCMRSIEKHNLSIRAECLATTVFFLRSANVLGTSPRNLISEHLCCDSFVFFFGPFYYTVQMIMMNK